MMQILAKCVFQNFTDQKILLYRLTEHAIKCLTVNGETVKNNKRLRWECGWNRNNVDQSNI